MTFLDPWTSEVKKFLAQEEKFTCPGQSHGTFFRALFILKICKRCVISGILGSGGGWVGGVLNCIPMDCCEGRSLTQFPCNLVI